MAFYHNNDNSFSATRREIASKISGNFLLSQSRRSLNFTATIQQVPTQL